MKKPKLLLAFLAAPAACVLAIWLPFGFAMNGLIEEWGILGLFSARGLFYIAGSEQYLPSHVLRPLTVLPMSVAYLLGPDSFVSWHLLLMLALVVKGACVSHLLWRATRRPAFAALAGALVLLYPADTMQLSFRSLHIDWALALVLLGSSLFLEAWSATRRRYVLCGIAAFVLLSAICMYEATLMLLPLPLLIVFVRGGVREAFAETRERWPMLAMWCGAAAVYVVYALAMSHRVGVYQNDIVAGRGLLSLAAGAAPKLFSVGALRAIAGGWIDAWRMVVVEFSSYAYLVAAALVITAAVLAGTFRLRRVAMQEGDVASHGPVAFRLAIVGVVLMLLGYLPYSLSPSHLLISQRTFLFASPGAVAIWIAMLLFVARYSRLLACTATFALVTLGLGAQLVQFHHYVGISEQQKVLVRSIVENLDSSLVGKTVLILDGSNQLGSTWMFIPGNLQFALTYFYGQMLTQVRICHAPSMEWELENSDFGRQGQCVEERDQWVFRYPQPVRGPDYSAKASRVDTPVDKSRIVQVAIAADGSIVHDPALDRYRADLQTADSTLARRYRGVLATSPWQFYKTMFAAANRPGTYRETIGRWWSLEVPIRGSGWREPEWVADGFDHVASAWKSRSASELYFDISPRDGQYALRGRFDVVLNDKIRASMQLRLNETDLPCGLRADGSFDCEIPGGLLKTGTNRIEFNSDTDDDYYGLSAKLAWYEVAPR